MSSTSPRLYHVPRRRRVHGKSNPTGFQLPPEWEFNDLRKELEPPKESNKKSIITPNLSDPRGRRSLE